MATKIKADLIFQYNILPVYFDDNTKTDNVLSEFDYAALMSLLNTKNASEFEIKLVSFDLINSKVSVFSTLFPDKEQVVKIWEIASDFTAGEQTTINNFIALL